MPTVCEGKDCVKKPIFNLIGHKGRFCIDHKSADMINVHHTHCEYEGCDKISPSYGIKGDRGRFCKIHKSVDMVNVKHKHCEFSECNTIANFDIKGGKGRFCVKHKENGMIDVKNKSCQYDGCIIQAIFDVKGGRGRFCIKHKEDGMIDVKNKRCEYHECTITPSYGFKEGKSRFCLKHKQDGMINMNTTYCQYEDCKIKHPIFGIIGGKGQFCKKHKSNDMIDVVHKLCEYEGCINLSIYDIKGGKGRFCIKHKEDDMINVNNSKRCQYAQCTTGVYYGKPGQIRSHCAIHRESGMIRRPNSKCIICKEPAIWGSNWIPLHCEIHKLDNESNLIEKKCSSCGLMYILNDKNLCEACDPELFVRVHLAKQNALFTYLDSRGFIGDSSDRCIDKGICGKERPDRMYDFGNKIVILECDEHQHRDRICSCEQTRMINIGQMFGGIPVYFIRWNPDDYNSKDDKKTPESIVKRHRLVGDLINSIKNETISLPYNLISVLYMYYDGWTTLPDEKWHVLMAFD